VYKTSRKYIGLFFNLDMFFKGNIKEKLNNTTAIPKKMIYGNLNKNETYDSKGNMSFKRMLRPYIVIKLSSDI